MKHIYPLFTVSDLPAAARFYTSFFGLEVVFEAEWYLHLVDPASGEQLAFIVPGHETVPAAFRARGSSGVILSMEVDDAAALASRAGAEKVELAYPLTDERFGQRHFMLVDPNGLLVDVIEPIEPDPAWLAEQQRS